MASGDSDQDEKDALYKLLQMGTVAEHQNEFEILINRVTRISQSLLTSFNISRLKLELQQELWRSRPTILGEAFSLAHIAKARYEEERATIAIAKPNNLTAKVQVQDLEKLLKDEETSLIILCWLRLITCYTLLLWRLCIKSSLHMGLVTPAEEVLDSRHNSTFSSLVEHESLQVLQLWEIIGIDDVHELMDNMGIYNFVQQNAGERMHLQAIVTGHPYQGGGGSLVCA
ncbi:hypothetical protein Tco_0949134 [Tanacetum coccineum]